MHALTRRLFTPLVAAVLGLTSVSALSFDGYSQFYKRGTILDTLVDTDGTQALVAAVLVVDESGVLDFSLADLLDNRRAEVVLLAPSNAAFEKLLGLDPGFLNGLSVQEVKDALPSLLPDGVTAGDVADILLKHAALPRKANRFTASEDALLKMGKIEVADGSTFPVSIGGSGVQVNYETTIVKADVVARNGIIHYLDTVIVDGLL